MIGRTPAVRPWPWVTLLLAAAALLIAALPAAPLWLQYDRAAIAAGEFGRLLTGHWTHVSGDHLFWDVLLFAILGVLCEQHNRRQFATCVGVSAGLIPLALWVFLPHLQTYRGLSGIDAALLTLLAVTHLRQALQERHRGRIAALTMLCLGFVGKVSYEVITGATLFVDSQAIAMIPVPLAHGIGAVVGLVVAWAAATPESSAPGS